MRDDALAHAFSIATDATGVLVQPIAGGDKQRRACHRGHYFVQLADGDHVFFEYTPKETSAAEGELFRGFSGYVQADAKSVYDAMFRPPAQRPPPDDDATVDDAERHEVGCRAHARRKFWEAAITKDPVAREGLARIARIFEDALVLGGDPGKERVGVRAEVKRAQRMDLRRRLLSAFCAWDGGYVPTEAEWDYAAAGGDEQRAYPWSSPSGSISIDCTLANYGGASPPGTACYDVNLEPASAVVGEYPSGDSRWGQADLGGNMLEWTLDWFAPYAASCNDCANLVPGSTRVLRGGDYADGASSLRNGFRRGDVPPSMRFGGVGFRCARAIPN